MAITNAQQYQQLVNKPANGKRPGYRGDDAYGSRSSSQGPAGGASSGGNYGGNRQSGSNFGSGNNTPSPGGNRNNNEDNRQTYNVDKKNVKTGPKKTDTRKLTSKDYDRGQSNFREQFIDYRGGSRPMTLSQRNNINYQNRIFNQARNNLINQLNQSGILTPELLKGLEEDDKLYDRDGDGKITEDDLTVENLRDTFQVSDDTVGADYGNRSLNLDALTGIKSIQDYVDEGFYKKDGVFDKNSDIYDKDRIPGPFKPTGTSLDVLGKIFAGPLTQEYLDKQFNNLEDIGSIPFDYNRDTSINALMEEYEPNRFKLQNSPRETGPSQQDPCLGPNPPAYCAVNNDPTDPATPKRNLGGLAPRFAGSIFDFTGLADGGRAGYMDGGMMEDTPEGGIMDLESGRQMYFLGKLVKKAGRAIKKVAKSPIGKAALLYFGGNALMSGGGGGLSSLFKSGKGLSLKNLIMGKPLGFKTAGDSVARSGGLLNFMKDNPYLSILGGSSLLAGLSGKGEDEGEIDYGPGIDIDRHRYAPYRTLAPGIIGSNYQTGTEGRKDGGRMGYAEGSKEPVAKETMPLLDMDGKEMDLRAEGGFVPLGRMERADDVPARLSKNEFVFTADAVRNAGEGDIDKGAEVMYNMMKNLESGGEVSEESQGLDGAREMFQTSQRLEEVL